VNRPRDPSAAAIAASLAAAAGRLSAAEKPKKPRKKASAAKKPKDELPSFDYPKEVAGIFQKIPAKDVETAQAACMEMVAGGPDMVKLLVKLVGEEFGDPKGVKPKYALHGLVIWASRPEGGTDRRTVAESLARELPAGHSDELKAFLCRQLQLCGRADEVPALGKLLTSPRLCEPATQALLVIGGEEAAAALREALPKAKGKQRATIIQGLGWLRDRKGAAAAAQAADDADRDVRLAAWYALGNAGICQAGGTLLKAAGARPGFEHTQALDAALRLGQQLAAEGRTDEAEKLCRLVLAAAKAPENAHERCAALHVLAMAAGVKAVDDVMAAMGSQELRYRVPGARTAVKLARSIRKDHKAEAVKLLERVLQATQEKAVLQEARTLLGEAGKQSPAPQTQ
jgi:hypothetical protein